MAETDFEPHRRYLTGIAYRMLGSYAEAEDVVQEVYLRWHRIDHGTVVDPRSFLARIATRLCLDVLKSARVRRESYVGPWLPEPLIEGLIDESSAEEELAGDLSVAMMLALERLSPLERAAFLLHDIFEMGFPAVAATIGRSEESARQLAARARKNLRSSRPRYKVDEAEESAITRAFFTASRTAISTHCPSFSPTMSYSERTGAANARRPPMFSKASGAWRNSSVATARKVSRFLASRQCASPASMARRASPPSKPMAFPRSCLSKSRTGRSLRSM
jgi:RNA polymerase sigma factor (sigma-70 family)